MKRALPVLVLSVAGLIPVWRYEPSAPAVSSVSVDPAEGSVTAGDTVTGTTVRTEKGDVQVQLTYDGDTITAVKLLKQPDHPQTAAAVPRLIAATLEAQSADIDTVSGATVTSDGYRESLQAAIDARGT
ncbi:FMN-binding protein [Streptomyces antibioticus]|uniref:FMN-binding protein n=1 Tax=Streptomyces antibioticus TaxID=1890 RepID=UPI0033E92778